MTNTTPAPASQPAADDPLQIVFGGVEMPVVYLDGREELVKVCYLAVARYPEFAGALNDEGRQVEMFCRQEKGWAGTIHPESHDRIMVEGHRLNLPFFERWAARRQAAQQAIDPSLQSRMERAARDVMRELIAPQVEALGLFPSGGSAPASPSPAGNP